MSDEIGLTNVDVKIINEIIDTYKFPKENLSMKQVELIFHEYKKIRNSAGNPKKKNRSTTFIAFIKYLFDRNMANYDTMLLLSAPKGTGKSSTAIQMARIWCKLIGARFSAKKYIAYDNADVTRLIKELPPFSPIICDEALRFIGSEDWNKAENKELKKIIGQVRTKHFFFIMCFPLKITKVDKSYLNSYIDYWVEMFDRGKGAIFIKDMNVSSDVWNIKRFEKLGNWNEFTSPKYIEKLLRSHPNFWEFIRVPKVPKNVYSKYIEIREENVYNDKNVIESMSIDDYQKAALILTLKDLIARDGTISINRVIKSIDRVYKIHITKPQLKTLMDDAKKLVDKAANIEVKK